MTAPTPGAVLDAESVKLLLPGDLLRALNDEPYAAGGWSSGDILTVGRAFCGGQYIEFQGKRGDAHYEGRFEFLARPTPEGAVSQDSWRTENPPAQPEPGAGELEKATTQVMAVLNFWFDGRARVDRDSEMVAELAEPLAQAQAKIARLEGEVARLTPKPNPHNDMTSAVYRDGPLTVELYDEAIADLQNAKRALIEGDGSGCQVCGDSGHSANGGCHHNPLILARKWARASAFWQCWHCGYVATNEAEAREHFGIMGDEDETPMCLESLTRRALSAEADAAKVREAAQLAIDAIMHLKPEKARFSLEQALAAQTERRA